MSSPSPPPPPDESLDDLILQSARLAVRLRKRLKAEHDDPDARYFFTYVLLLQNECIYVGSTNSLYMRLYEHLHETEMSSNWVKFHGPVIRVLEVSKNAKKDDEVYKTLEYMTMFGWQSVRGAHWCKVELKGPPTSLADFKRTRSDFDYLDRGCIEAALDIARQLKQID
jgi:hypothetical protein